MKGSPAYLRQIQLKRNQIATYDEYPFDLPVIRNLHTMDFHPKVTYIVGENGMGKSTLMESIAVSWGFNPEGGTMNFTFSTRATHSDLYEYVQLVKGTRRPKDGFFFRAESYYNLATTIDELDREPSYGAPIKDSYGGKSLHEQSHGESFFPRLFIGLAVMVFIFWTSLRRHYRRFARWPCLPEFMSW